MLAALGLRTFAELWFDRFTGAIRRLMLLGFVGEERCRYGVRT